MAFVLQPIGFLFQLQPENRVMYAVSGILRGERHIVAVGHEKRRIIAVQVIVRREFGVGGPVLFVVLQRHLHVRLSDRHPDHAMLEHVGAEPIFDDRRIDGRLPGVGRRRDDAGRFAQHGIRGLRIGQVVVQQDPHRRAGPRPAGEGQVRFVDVPIRGLPAQNCTARAAS